jgi:hypothetical protein
MNRRARPTLLTRAAVAVLFGSSLANAAPPAPEAAPADTGDIVETIDADAPPTATAAAPPTAVAEAPQSVAPAPAPELAPPPPSPDRFELHGWARQSLEVGLAKRSPQSDD